MSEPTLTLAAFAAKWKGIETSLKASAQSHFLDLCRMLGEPTPHEADPIGSQFAFEKRVVKAGGGDGFADVWKRDFFAWEYKGKYKDLKAAYVQLLNYKDDLGNPPLLVVSDLDRIEIHTNFTSLSPVTRGRHLWIIDFGVDMTELDAALYEAPFEYVRPVVKPIRLENRREAYAERWWLHVEPRSGMRKALAGLNRYLATTRLSPHRIFAWVPSTTLPDSRLIVFATQDDFFFGVLQSRVHDVWSPKTAGAQRREALSGFTYTPTTTFETFPRPRPTSDQRERVREAARRVGDLRDGWLNPPGLDPSDLEKRTLTNLYNQRPTWLANAHEELNTAVLDAYGWPGAITDSEILERLLALNLERSASQTRVDGA